MWASLSTASFARFLSCSNAGAVYRDRRHVNAVREVYDTVQQHPTVIVRIGASSACVNGEEGRAWPHVVAGSAFRVQQPGAGTRDWTRTRCDDCADDWGSPSRVDGRTCCLQRFALGGACPARRKTVAGARFFKRQPLAGRSNHGARFFKRQRIAGRRHHPTTNCGKLVTERPMRSPLPVCADPARKCRGLDAASTSHEQVGLCAMQCLLCNACQTWDGDVVLLNALLCVHGAHA